MEKGGFEPSRLFTLTFENNAEASAVLSPLR